MLRAADLTFYWNSAVAQFAAATRRMATTTAVAAHRGLALSAPAYLTTYLGMQIGG